MKPEFEKILKDTGIEKTNSGAAAGSFIESPSGPDIKSTTPIDGSELATVKAASADDFDAIMERAEKRFETWRTMPAPKRGEVVRLIGDELRKHKRELGALVTLEMGKIVPEGEGEVQEMIDISDFALGLSRQLYGLTIKSERPGHRMMEQWHPLGTIGIISAFNFPVAVWSWNAFLAAVCGDTMVWKPSSKVPLTAIAVQKIVNNVTADMDLDGVFNLAIGRGRDVGERLIQDRRVPLVSFTGSTAMGKRVGEVVGARLGSTILELGGNNAVVVDESADLELALNAILFGAVGTAGQRCTSTRRVIAHESVYDKLKSSLLSAYRQVRIGNPLDKNTLMGPMIDQGAVDTMMKAIGRIKESGGTVLCGGDTVSPDGLEGGFYVEPAIAEADNSSEIVQEETFAPILYLMRFSTIEEAIRIHNDVPQGLSSAMFTRDLLSAEAFLSPAGSDCGIANVNLGTSGAEIGGAFGGEKETGGGRESGSDAWKAYMRRQTNTVNYSTELPLAQGIEFDL
ncbi:MAG: aldehyde dehydrogenase family protein [Candidatus Eisenbacteria bacterium]|nr:aldehyde dehydrogenase family protein [Candidatus Eisenbacteria bacterium]